jgi:hypothetical protein
LLAGTCYGGSLLARIAGKEWGAYALRREMAGSGPRARRLNADGYIGLGRREIESAIYDSDPGNAWLWHASASTDARHFSIASNPDLVNDRCGSWLCENEI